MVVPHIWYSGYGDTSRVLSSILHVSTSHLMRHSFIFQHFCTVSRCLLFITKCTAQSSSFMPKYGKISQYCSCPMLRFFSPLHIISMSMTFCPRTFLLREADDLLAEQVCSLAWSAAVSQWTDYAICSSLKEWIQARRSCLNLSMLPRKRRTPSDEVKFGQIIIRRLQRLKCRILEACPS